MRFLCLHGMGTNAQILEFQTAAIRRELGEPHSHTFDFVEGELQEQPAQGFESLGIAQEDHFAFYDNHSAESILAAIDDLSAYVNETGPYDAIFGFSQGATLAAMLLMRQGHESRFHFGVFICAGTPYDLPSLCSGVVRFSKADIDGVQIHVPTAHIYGQKDPDWRHAIELSLLCQPYGRVVLDHGAGHEIPRAPMGITEAMCRVIEKVIGKATAGQ